MNTDFRTEHKAAEDNPLDALRNTIELENRFKSAFHGYDRKSVQDYIAQLSAASQKALDLQSEELEDLKKKYAELLARAENQDKLVAEARAEERRKLEGAVSIKESMLETLRAANQRLESENHQLQLTITDLTSKLSEAEARHADNCSSVSALDAQFSELLNGKFAECSGIISSWQQEASRLLKPAASN